MAPDDEQRVLGGDAGHLGTGFRGRSHGRPPFTEGGSQNQATRRKTRQFTAIRPCVAQALRYPAPQVTSAAELQSHLYRLAERVLLAPNELDKVPIFKQWLKATLVNPHVAGQGIVVA